MICYINKYIKIRGDIRSKYYSKKIVVDGIKFDSKKEAAYYQKLKILEKADKIKNLTLQKEFLLQEKFKLNGKTRREINYRADFSYISTDDDKLHIVDVKGYRTDVYKLKKKLFEYKYGIEIEEV